LISSTSHPSRSLVTLAPTPTIASNSKEVVYDTPTHRPFPVHEDDDDDEDDNDFAEEYVQTFGREIVGPIASPYIVPYL